MINDSADVDERAEIHPEANVWHLAQVRERARIGPGCVIGRGVYVGPGVSVGRNTKIQNFAQIYDPAEIGQGVFIGPAVVLTNDVYPRSVEPDGSLKRSGDWDSVGVRVSEGASIGARAVVLAGVTIGRWALVGAGSTVIRDVPDFAVVVGNPARQIGWVGRAGHRLTSDTGSTLRCPLTGETYEVVGDQLRPADDRT